MNIYSLVESGRHQTTCWKRSTADDMSLRFVHTFRDPIRIDPTPTYAAALCPSMQHNLQTVHKPLHCIEQERKQRATWTWSLFTYSENNGQSCRPFSRSNLSHAECRSNATPSKTLIDWLIDWLGFNAVFNNFSLKSRRPVHLLMHFLVFSNQYSPQQTSQATGCFFFI